MIRSCVGLALPAVLVGPTLFLAVLVSPIAAEPLTLDDQGRRWVDDTLATLTPRQKAAQLVMIRAFGQHVHPESSTYRDLVDAVATHEVGGVVAFDSDVASLPMLLADLQDVASLPLLVASDLERGADFRIQRGTVPLPYAMALGAADSEALAAQAGAITAREALALGIHWIFAPVVDVNVNPANPVINIRSFGEDPARVAALAAAFVRGARAGGVLTTAKHFPGHGDTATDSHHTLPTIHADRARLEAVELMPFRATIDAGVDAVMLAHLAVPALDPSGTPASLSVPIVDGLLRGTMGFDGLVVTDALEMKGVQADWPGIATVQAVVAGADVVLLPPDHRVAINALTRAVAEGVLPMARLDDAVRRVLTAKARAGLHRDRMPSPAALRNDVARPDDLRAAESMAEAAVTVVRNRGAVLPLRAETPLNLLHLTLISYPRASASTILREGLAIRGVAAEHHTMSPEITNATIASIVRAAPSFSHIVVTTVFAATSTGPSTSQRQLLDQLLLTGPPMVVVSIDSPYTLGRLPDVPVYICTYGGVASSQRAAVAALFGEIDVGGTLPVSLPGMHPRGHGVTVPRRAMTLATQTPVEAGLPADAFAPVDQILDDFVAAGAFPGGVLAVVHRGALLHLRPFGHVTYDEGAASVAADTLYDLASLTKVIATTSMAMMLVDEERLVLDARVQSFLPGFTGAGKERVTVRHLLTHSAGVDWWAPLYERLEGPEAYLAHIQSLPLAYEPGTETRYSDLGLMLLGAILERASGQSLDAFVQTRVFGPLGMKDTQFNPSPALRPRIAPTEVDTTRRQGLVHGTVHDENAQALGGVAPHAGLFGTAIDLARFAQFLLNGGVFEHQRLVARDTVARFTRKAGVVEGSDRALGWDTKSAEGSSAGRLFSDSSFGHTGFTGTSLWLDPERDLALILLTNRVHPTRENKQIRTVRPAVADAVVRALSPGDGHSGAP